jgi:hypothetical protein
MDWIKKDTFTEWVKVSLERVANDSGGLSKGFKCYPEIISSTAAPLLQVVVLPYLAGKSRNTQGTRCTKWEKGLDFEDFSSPAHAGGARVVFLVFEKVYPVENGGVQVVCFHGVCL